MTAATDVPNEILTQVLSPVSLGPHESWRDEETRKQLRKEVLLVIDESALPNELVFAIREFALRPARTRTIQLLQPGRSSTEQTRRGREGIWHVSFENDEGLVERSFVISINDDEPMSSSQDLEHGEIRILIRYRRKCEAFRALGHVLAATRYALALSASSSLKRSSATKIETDTPSPRPLNDDDDISLKSASSLANSWTETPSMSSQKQRLITFLSREETCLFETLGALVDCSRNGVPTVESMQLFLRQQALVGCNLLHLYTEDTYQIPGEPFFGYFRGPYTAEEIRAIDDYADQLGIELVPCIQTLGHLANMLQWPRYNHMQDTADVLMADNEHVYAFIEKAIKTLASNVRSRRIHIGMDEAFGLGEGRYKAAHPEHRDKEGTQIFIDHLKRVNAICRRIGVKPIIWSDMLFCLASRNVSLNGYYDSGTPELSESIPEGVETCFWSYYHTLPKPYADKIEQHWQLANKAPWMASGLWTWGRFWCSLPFTFETVRASMKASKAKEAGVKHCITTIWGDEGNEADIFSCLPGLQYYAEHAYTMNDEIDVALLKLKFDGIAGGSFDSFVNGSKLDDLHPEFQPAQSKAILAGNMSKWLLWEEPFYGFLSPQYSSNYDLERHYGDLADYLALATAPVGDEDTSIGLPLYPFNVRLQLPFHIAQVLSLKCHLRDWLYQAYKNQDLAQLNALAGPGSTSRLGQLRLAVDSLWRYHRTLWMTNNKPFGWEVLELRYGGLRARLETMQDRIAGYLDSADNSITHLPELEVQTQPIWAGHGPSLMLEWSRAAKVTAY